MTLSFNPEEVSPEQTQALMDLVGEGGIVEDFQRTTPGDGVPAVDIGSRASAPATWGDRATDAGAHGAVGALVGAGGIALAREAGTDLLAHQLRRDPMGTIRSAFRNPRGTNAVARFMSDPKLFYGTAAAGAGLGALHGALTSPRRSEEVVYGQMTPKTSMLPQMNPALAVAASVIEPTSGSEMVRTIQEVDRAEREARRQELYEEKARENAIMAAHKQRQAEEKASHEALMTLLADNNAASRVHTDLARLQRQDEPLEESLASALGLSPILGGGEDPDKEQTPMEGAGMGMKSSDVRQAGLVGYQGQDNPFQEVYLEETDPTARDRVERGLVGGGVGALLGGGVGYAAQLGGAAVRDWRHDTYRGLRYTSPSLQTANPRITWQFRDSARRVGGMLANPRTAAIGTLLGLAGGGLGGALSNRGVTTGYNTASGEELGFLDEMEARKVFDELNPGQQPGNFAVGDPQTMPGLGSGAPEVAYAVDLDEAISEDPILQASLMKGSSVLDAVRYSYGLNAGRIGGYLGL